MNQLSDAGADIRYASGRDMSPLYGTGRKIVGIHHTKAIYLTGDWFRRLWIGSANFTSASEYNKELMVELTQLTQTE